MSNKIRKKQKKSPARPGKPTISPQESQLLQQMMAQAEQFMKQGDLDRAEQIYTGILGKHPTHAPSLHMMGLIYHLSNNMPLAEELIKKSIHYQQDNPQYYFHLGIVQEDLLTPRAAVRSYEKALHFRPRFAEAHLGLANALVSCGENDTAAVHYQKAIDLHPALGEAHHGKGSMLLAQGRAEEAAACFARALEQQPDLVRFFIEKAADLEKRGVILRALAYIEKALQLAPDSVECLGIKGKLEMVRGDLDRAVESIGKGLSLDPDNPYLLTSLGNILMSQGKMTEARESLLRAQYLAPDQPDTYQYLAACEKNRDPENPMIRTCLDLLAGKENSNKAVPLFFSLGKMYDDAAAFDQAFSHYQKGNQLKLSTAPPFSREQLSTQLDKVIEAFPADYMSMTKSFGSESELPVFIVGMPRSGTTLTEQIIAAHPQGSGAGELNEIDNLVKRLTVHLGPMPSFEKCIKKIHPKFLRTLSEIYLSVLPRKNEGNILRISDKMPFNYLHLGWITLLFPRARILHCTRNPVDTCLSIYFQNFEYPMPFTSDLASIGVYYREYHRLMNHWRRVLPQDRFLELPYEDLVSDFEDNARKLINFIGLDWNDSCLSFHKKKRDVITASAWQARQPIYTSSVERWRNYEKHLGPLLAALGDLAPTELK